MSRYFPEIPVLGCSDAETSTRLPHLEFLDTTGCIWIHLEREQSLKMDKSPATQLSKPESRSVFGARNQQQRFRPFRVVYKPHSGLICILECLRGHRERTITFQTHKQGQNHLKMTQEQDPLSERIGTECNAISSQGSDATAF